MKQRAYRPRRAQRRWLEGAPVEVLDVWDNGGRTADRYTVYLFGNGFGQVGKHAGDTAMDYLAMSDAPTHPQGFSQWGQCSATARVELAYFKRAETGRRVRWCNLPEHIRSHVLVRMVQSS